MRLAALSFALFSLWGCGGLFYFPEKNPYYSPEKNGFVKHEIRFKTSDGVELTGWYFLASENFPADAPARPKKPAKATIVQFHGNAENMTSHFASLVWLTREGYDLFTFDYRGYGGSTGEPNAKGVYTDGMTALDQAWALHKKAGAGKFIVYAQSLGGIVAARALYDFKQRTQTNLLVLDSTFCSFKDVVQEKLASIWVTWIFSPLGRLSVSDKYASIHVLPHLQVPTLVVHDKTDPVVDFQNGERIFNLLGSEKKTFWKTDEGRHVGFFDLRTPEHRKRFMSFVEAL